MKIHVLHTGEVRVSPYLPFGGDNCNLLKASGMTTPKEDWIWLPVSVYLIEHPKGLILVDTGWHRDMSPEGVYDKASIAALMTFAQYLMEHPELLERPLSDLQENMVKIQLALPEGKVLALVGESGCGKSVLCRSVMKLLPRTAKIKSGSIIADGVDITNYGERDMRRLRRAGIRNLSGRARTRRRLQ